jgi:hypothetical protein
MATNKQNLEMVKMEIKNLLLQHLPIDGIVEIILDYFLKTVALFFSGVTSYRDHQPDTVCYKAMNYSDWELLVEKVSSKKAHIRFNYDIGEPSMSSLEILKHTRLLESPQLIRALEIISPHHLGSDIDVFEALNNGQPLLRAYDSDGEEVGETNSEAVEKLWMVSPIQQHLVKKS